MATEHIDRSVARSVEELTGNMQFFTLYTTIDITTTGDYKDKSQKIFDNIITLISTRAQPIIVGDPYSVSLIENEGAPSLTGNGYVFKFVTEHPEVFASVNSDHETTDEIFHLNFMFNDIEVQGETFYTEGANLNIEFKLNEQI